MTYRPYPNADRALRHIQRNQAFYQYGRFPQRYVMGIPDLHGPGMAEQANKALRVAGEAVRPLMEALRGIRVDVAPMADSLNSLRRPA